jgi:cell division protein FtsQ
MAGIAPISRSELNQRRKQLRQQRRAKRLLALFRFGAAVGVLTLAIWVVKQPLWVIRNAEQVRVEGNQFLSAQTLRGLVPIAYPQSIFRTQPQQIIDTLKSKAPLSNVRVERRLFPPELIVKVTEQTPVATIFANNQPDGKPSSTPNALIDAQGNVIPLEAYKGLEQNIQLPSLKILGKPEEYKQHWAKFYQLTKAGAIGIQQIDWRNPGNIILTTDLGVVHCGAYGDGFPLQLRALEGLRKLPENLPRQQIDYIDLRNPNRPALQKKAPAKTAIPNSSETLDNP